MPLPRLLPAALVATLLAGVPTRAADEDRLPHVVARAADLLERVVPHVEAAYGAEFAAPPRVVVLAPREAERVFREDLRKELGRRHADATEGQRAALLAASARSSVASCIARYSFRAEAIVLVRDSFDVQRRAAGFAEHEAQGLLLAVLAHEAVHALDDARHDLEGFYADAPDVEALRARAMVAEGRAVVFGRRAAAAAGAPERACALLPGGDAPRDLHAWLLRLTYEGGAAYVAAQERAGDAAALTGMLRAPPATTHAVFHPGSTPDRRAEELVRSAAPDATVTALSELQLRARYAALHDAGTAARLFAGFRGGAQALVDATNVAVLCFADDAAATDYVEVAGEEAPTTRRGTLVLRAFGPAADDLLRRLEDAWTRRSGD